MILYPELRTVNWLTYNFVKNKIAKIVREVLRTIEMITSRDNITLKYQVIINDAKIKEINKSAYSLDLQMLCSEIYRDKSFNVNNIHEVVRLMW